VFSSRKPERFLHDEPGGLTVPNLKALVLCFNRPSNYIDVESFMLKPILLVEDNPYDLELTLLALERSHLANDVISVRDGEKALAYLRRESQWSTRKVGNPAVVLLDLKLPKLMAYRSLKPGARTRSSEKSAS